jgi:transcriptional regulator with XRE-family HTH domain
MSSGRKQAPKLDLKSVGRRIREIRGFDLTQVQFGEMMGVGQTTLSKYEKGQAAPTLEFLVRLKAHSGRSIDWIITGDGESSSNKP